MASYSSILCASFRRAYTSSSSTLSTFVFHPIMIRSSFAYFSSSSSSWVNNSTTNNYTPVSSSSYSYSSSSFNSTTNDAKDQIKWEFNSTSRLLSPDLPEAVLSDNVRKALTDFFKIPIRRVLWGARKVDGQLERERESRERERERKREEEDEEEEEYTGKDDTVKDETVCLKMFLPGLRKENIRITLLEDERNQNKVMLLIERECPYLVNVYDFCWCGSCFLLPKKSYELKYAWAEMDQDQFVLKVFIPKAFPSSNNGFIRTIEVQ